MGLARCKRPHEQPSSGDAWSWRINTPAPSPLWCNNSEVTLSTLSPKVSHWNQQSVLTCSLTHLHWPPSFSYFMSLLMHPGSTSQINHLLSNPCLRLCFQGIPFKTRHHAWDCGAHLSKRRRSQIYAQWQKKGIKLHWVFARCQVLLPLFSSFSPCGNHHEISAAHVLRNGRTGGTWVAESLSTCLCPWA